uniref:Uncharacterized protein n=1 Tax=Ditylenchus dipsaci TaxID=166011 RepID=A0A915DPS4_9BILA
MSTTVTTQQLQSKTPYASQIRLRIPASKPINNTKNQVLLQQQYDQLVLQYQVLLDAMLENNNLYYSLVDRFDRLNWQFNSLADEHSKLQGVVVSLQALVEAETFSSTITADSNTNDLLAKEDIEAKSCEETGGGSKSRRYTEEEQEEEKQIKEEGTMEFVGQSAGLSVALALCPPVAPFAGFLGKKIGGKIGG